MSHTLERLERFDLRDARGRDEAMAWVRGQLMDYQQALAAERARAEKAEAEAERLRDEADRERLARRDRDAWLVEIVAAVDAHWVGRPVRCFDGPEKLPARVEYLLKELGRRCHLPCPKCGGEGWVWRHELDRPHIDPQCGIDDTKYTCDRCKGSRVDAEATRERVGELEAEAERLRGDCRSLAGRLACLLRFDVRGDDTEGYTIAGLWTGTDPHPTREEAEQRLIDYVVRTYGAAIDRARGGQAQ